MGHGGDEAVGHGVHAAVVVAQHHLAQRHRFHETAPAGDLHHVSAADLVLNQQEVAREVVLDEALRAKADSHAHDTRGTENRRDRHTEFVEHPHAGNQQLDNRQRIGDGPAHSLDLLGVLRPAGARRGH